MRDRLIELLRSNNAAPEKTCPRFGTGENCEGCKYLTDDIGCDYIARTADYLLANGVIVPPCKVGDTVYYINRYFHIELKKDTIYEAKVVRIVTTSLGTSLVIQMRGEWGCIEQSNIDCIETPNVKDFDRIVFLTKEEAEAALKGGEE